MGDRGGEMPADTVTKSVSLTVDRVGKLHTATSALPGLRTHQLQLAVSDMVAHHYHAGQHLWLRLQRTASVQPALSTATATSSTCMATSAGLGPRSGRGRCNACAARLLRYY